METELNEKTKVCTGCGRTLPLSQFARHSKSADGYMSMCNDCRRRQRYKATADTKDNPLEKFTAIQLMKELKYRGYRGHLTYTEVRVVKFDEL